MDTPTALCLFFTTFKSIAEKALALYTVKFRLGYCGSDEEVKALTSEAIGAAESFLGTFFGKKWLELAAQEAGKP